MTSRANHSDQLPKSDREDGQKKAASDASSGAAEAAVEPEQLPLTDILNLSAAPRTTPERTHPLRSPARRTPPTEDSDLLTRRSPSRPITPRLLERDLERAPVLAEEAAIATAQAALVHASVLGHQRRSDQGAPSAQADFSGRMLRSLRESRGLALHELAERTRISVKHLENIEADRYNALPPTVYLRGILRSLARELRLDPARVSSSYIALASEAKARRNKR